MEGKPSTGDRLERRDILAAALAGFFFAGLYLVFSARGCDPALWSDLAAAAGLRPPQTVVPGVWRLLAKVVMAVFGVARAPDVLRLCGAAVGGGCVALACLAVRQTLAVLSRAHDVAAWRPIALTFSVVAAAAFGASDAMWRIVSPLSPGGIRFFVFLVALCLFLRWLATSARWRILVVMFLSGALASESLFAVLIPVLCCVAHFLAVRSAKDRGFKPECSLRPLPQWPMFFAFAAGFLTFMSVEIGSFVASDGFAASGWSAVDLFVRYAVGLVSAARRAATLIGWFFLLAFQLLPLAFALILFPKLCRDTEPLRFAPGVGLLCAGVFSLAQCAVLPFVPIWSSTFCMEDIALDSLGCLLSLATAVTLALAASCFALGSRNRFEYQSGGFEAVKLRGVCFRSLVFFVVILGVAPLALRVRHAEESELRAVVREALDETVRECGDAKFLFTDGLLDAGLELRAAQLGSEMKPLGIVVGGGAWGQYIRMRHFDKFSWDYDRAQLGAAALLDAWAGGRTNGMDRAAVQLGFELWQRAHKPPPKMSGLVARETGMSDEEAARGVEAAKGLADRILRIAKEHPDAVLSPGVKSAVAAVSWRISRFARLREDNALADELDEHNEPVKRATRRSENERMSMLVQMTPEEGLQYALRRADFTSARRYGATILKGDPDDPEANFGTGMAYLVEGNLKEAERYLERTLKRRPDEPAVLNNLAIIYRRTNRLKEALEAARKAHEQRPENIEIKKTLESIEHLMAEQESEKPTEARP